jgi:hypothetical protein
MFDFMGFVSTIAAIVGVYISYRSYVLQKRDARVDERSGHRRNWMTGCIGQGVAG